MRCDNVEYFFIWDGAIRAYFRPANETPDAKASSFGKPVLNFAICKIAIFVENAVLLNFSKSGLVFRFGLVEVVVRCVGVIDVCFHSACEFLDEHGRNEKKPKSPLQYGPKLPNGPLSGLTGDWE